MRKRKSFKTSIHSWRSGDVLCAFVRSLSRPKDWMLKCLLKTAVSIEMRSFYSTLMYALCTLIREMVGAESERFASIRWPWSNQRTNVRAHWPQKKTKTNSSFRTLINCCIARAPPTEMSMFKGSFLTQLCDYIRNICSIQLLWMGGSRTSSVTTRPWAHALFCRYRIARCFLRSNVSFTEKNKSISHCSRFDIHLNNLFLCIF